MLFSKPFVLLAQVGVVILMVKYRILSIVFLHLCRRAQFDHLTNEDLRFSFKKIGQLYPILTDASGNIIDGNHRFAVDKNWRKETLDYIKTEKDGLIVKIVSNNVRRKVSRTEKTKTLSKMAEIYSKEGFSNGAIAKQIAQDTGMSYQWVIKYLPTRFKDLIQSQKAMALHRIADMNKKKGPPKNLFYINNYGNTNFVNIALNKSIFSRVEEKAKKQNMTPTQLLYSAIQFILRSS